MCCRGGEEGILKEGDISIDKVAINVGRITTIPHLNVRITQEGTLSWLWLKVCVALE